MNKTLLLLILLVGGWRNLAAQDEVPPPKPPFVRLPKEAAWEIKVESDVLPLSVAGKPPKGVLKRIESVHTGDTKHDTLVNSDGSSSEVWYEGKYRLELLSNGQEATVFDPAGDPVSGLQKTLPYTSGFPGVDWITAADYQRAVRQSDKLYYEFARKAGDKVLAQAWIDSDTSLPVFVQVGPLKYTFAFKAPPTGPLVLPEPFAKAWSDFEVLEARRRLPVPPRR